MPRASIEAFDVRGGGPLAPARSLSGGNMQKLILGRALLAPEGQAATPRLIVAHQPTWGLDIGAVAYVQQQLIAARDAGAAVLLISDDLDEVMTLGDRIAVMHHGRLTERAPRRRLDARRHRPGDGGRGMRVEKRLQPSPAALALASLGAVAFTLLVSSVLVLAAGAPVGRTYGLLLQGAFGSVFAWSETLTRAVPLLLTGLAAAVAFRARLFNIGAEGQLYAGALAAVAVGGLHGGSGFGAPTWLLFPAMLVAAALAGALLLLGPTLLKARLGVDEVVTTLLLNFIVLLFVSAMLDGPMKDPGAMGWPQSVALQPELELARLVQGTRVHSGLAIALVLAAGVWALLRHTVAGFDIRAVGANARAAAFAGVPVTRTLVLVALLSGGLAGLAGAIEVAGRTSYVTLDMSPGYGYSGIVIAMLAGLHPLGVAAAAVFVAGVLVGADSMSRAIGVPTYLADVIVAVSLLSVLVATLAAQYRLRLR